MVQAPSLVELNTAQDVIEADLNYICDHLKEEFAAMSGKQLLITGGAGFLGYYLVQSVFHWNTIHPSQPPIQLTIYENFIRGIPDWLTNLKDNPNLTLVKHDITNPLPADIGNFQFIIHAASIASPIFYRKYPIETMDANVNGLRYLLEYCRQQKEAGTPVEGFLFYSTSEIYGDPTPGDIPTPETYRGNVSCTGPRACYDESKRYGETLCVNFAQQYDLPIKTARPFNNYGPGLKITDRRVLPDFVRDVLNGRDIVMLSDGAPTRTFCYIADAIVGYYKILAKGRPGEAYNIGVETPEISMAELAERVVTLAKELWGYEGKVVRQASADKDYLVDNPNRRCPIIDKARADLGYDPSITIDEGLKRSMVWYQDNREAEDA
ncbi:NAD-dependent epimerase/dehydratase family protein [Pseudanabaena sp. FACHB-2040]|uniref:NAD-dependent epimerase/dehydratase family protein n=1 Tax=Pseudanabaena sp. FACHB-2040 TaxID=2692859 RepID=UPI00168374DC|nr:NAD-dependent epimerase/dehydratase family protein [Pseudanabaena sp. FACHB-2040]MBD0269641.1 NAD-dependent epimerase/dehydratase family protein [Cyanobacteria bacterium Co-bin8]MBD2257777.1 NAD-dependent epimerase/dehydratase family protein [Pseudanabaena sp. FACHB-2040]